MAHLTIEPLTEAHADLLFAAYQEHSIYTYIPSQPPQSREALRQQFKAFAAGAPPGSNEIWLNWVIKYGETQQIVGTLQATWFADNHSWIGYTIVPAYWGQGIASAAVGLLLADLRQRFGAHTVFASVDTRNIASIKVLEHNGFTLARKEAAEIRGVPTEDYILTFQL